MFSKLRKSKSEKPKNPPKLRGMPALKQMRSSKREESLSTKSGPVLSTLSALEKKTIANGKEAVHPTREELERHETPSIAITPNYKRSVSPDSGHHSGSRKTNYVDRISYGSSPGNVFYGEISPGITQDIPELNEELDDEHVDINSPWRISNGDSGYKSKDEGKTETTTKMKSRKKPNEKQSTTSAGLHQIKQQRKASRESVSQSMRALTPKERESIQCLEDVLKDHSDGNESFEEVFDSESSGHDFEHEMDMIYIQAKMRLDEEGDDAIDYGYASVNDISRRYSVESMESVGSIIDLVGNLSASPSSQTSPLYNGSGMSRNHSDVTNPDDVMESANDDVVIMKNAVVPDDFNSGKFQFEAVENERDDVIIHPEDAITQLDDVINSFSVQSDEERENDEHVKVEKTESHSESRKDKSSRRHKSRESVTDDERELKRRAKRNKSFQTDEEHAGRKERSESRSDKKKKKKHKRHKSKDSATDDEKERKRRERKKERDSETDQERKERKKKRKEEKRGKKKEKIEVADEAKRREEDIARHVDEISALTQNMIKTAQNDEPIYAQVKKPKSRKDINENLQPEYSVELDIIPDPPPQFGNSPILEVALSEEESLEHSNTSCSNEQALSRTPGRQNNFSKCHLTSTPVVSQPHNKMSHTSMQDAVEPHILPTQGSKRPVSDSTQYAHLVQPYFSKFQPQISGRLHVSQSMLEESSHNLNHIDPHAPKVLQVNPRRNAVKETSYESTPTPFVSKDTPVSRSDPKRLSDVPKPQINMYRHPAPVRHNPRPGRPVSLNLDDGRNVGADKRSNPQAKPYSSFREDRSNVKPGQKARPFVIRASKKPIQLY